MSVMRGRCDARPTVTFSAARHHRTLAGTKLYCLGICVLTTFPGCTRQRGGWDLNPRPVDRKSSTLPLRHRATHCLPGGSIFIRSIKY